MARGPEAMAPLEAEGAGGPEPGNRLVLIRACDEWFALRIEEVREIQPLGRITRVPNAPPEVLGIMNLRGRVLTLYDLGLCLAADGEARAGGAPASVVVLDFHDPELEVGIAVQTIAQVKEVPARDLEAAVSAARGIDSRGGSLSALLEVDGRVVGLLDLGRIFGRLIPDWGRGEGAQAPEAPSLPLAASGPTSPAPAALGPGGGTARP